MVSTGQAKTVKTRRVFYIPGYDPIHPAGALTLGSTVIR